MRRILILIFCLMLTACMPVNFLQQPTSPAPSSLQPQVDLQATADVMAATQAAQTVDAVFAETPTGAPTATATIETVTATDTPDMVGTMTATLLTAPPPTEATGTVEPTITPLTIDKLPAGTIYGSILLVNQSHTAVDVSLHCTTHQGLTTVIEVDHIGRRQVVEAPLGKYVVVAYIGGSQVITSFSYLSPERLTLTFEKDQVIIH